VFSKGNTIATSVLVVCAETTETTARNVASSKNDLNLENFIKIPKPSKLSIAC
jgi:hypothetical protein